MQNITLIMSIATITGSILFFFLAIRQNRKAKEAEQTWVKASGTVLDSGLTSHRHRSSKGVSTTNFSPRVSYQYQVMGQTYRGDRIGFGSGASSRSKAEKIIAAYPEDALVTVFYDPADPSKAVLETKAVGTMNYIALGIILLILGVMVFVILPR